MSCATRSSKQRIRHIVRSSVARRVGVELAGTTSASVVGYAATGAEPSTWCTAPAIFVSSGST